MLVSWMCGYFLSPKKCNLRPTKVQRYLGMLCDSDTASFRVPPDKMAKLHDLLSTALAAGEISFRTLERIAGKCMSMTVAIRPASLWTHAMLTALSELEKSGLRRVDLSKVEFGELRGEFRRWISTSSTSHEGPVAKGPPLYGGSRRRRYGRIFHRVGGRSQRGGGTVSRGGTFLFAV